MSATYAKLNLVLLTGRYAVCRLPADSALPLWGCRGEFFSISKSTDELSILCEETFVPSGTLDERGWRCFRVEGQLDFSLTGILNSLTGPLAESGISIFAVSTFNTDYLLVKETALPRAIEALTAAGHKLLESGK